MDNVKYTFKNKTPNMKVTAGADGEKIKTFGDELDEVNQTKEATKVAHSPIADQNREQTMEIRKHSTLTKSLSESFDFIEESYGTGELDFRFYDNPSEGTITEGLSENLTKYKTIGIAEGTFAPIGVMSRNNRMYDDDHYPYILEDQNLKDKIAHRGMCGTIGHHDKKVDDSDFANGLVSHIVTDLHVVESADGTKNLHGTLEIMDTPAGHLLKTYYEHGVPLYVSSRGGGKLLPVANESYKRVDKKNYHLETFDIVTNPGFLQAKPQYLGSCDCVGSVKESFEGVNGMNVNEQIIIIQNLLKDLSSKLNNYNDSAREMANKEHSIEPKELVKQKCGEEKPAEDPVKGKEVQVSEEAMNKITQLLMLDKIINR